MLELLVHGVVPQAAQHGQPGRRRQRVPRERARLVDVADRRQLLHQVAAPAERGERQPAAGDLAEDGQVRDDAEALLRAAAGHAEAGDDLVEDEQRAGQVTEPPQPLEEARHGRDDAHVPGDRLDEHARQPLAVCGHRLGGRVEVVVGADDRVRRHRRRNTGRRRDAERRQPRARRREQGVDVAVVAARELEHAVAARRRAREPDRAHRRLGARGDETHLLHGRHSVDDLGGELDLALGGRAEARPVAGRRPHGLDRLRIGVPEEERPPGHDPVEQAPAVGVLEVRALAPPHEERLVQPDGAHRAHRRVDAARDQRPRPPGQLAAGPHSDGASSLAQYVTIRSAPARRIAVSDSSAACRSSSHPRAAAAFTIAYSPETL